MLVETFENNGESISENIGQLKFEQNIKSLHMQACQIRMRTHFDPVHS